MEPLHLLCCGWNTLLVRLARGELSLLSPKVFFSVLSPMEFWFLPAVASGLLSWGHFISSDIIDLIAPILFIWTERDDAITKLNNENWTENWVLNLVILQYWDTVFQFWHCAVAFLQFVLLKRYINKGDLTTHHTGLYFPSSIALMTHTQYIIYASFTVQLIDQVI